MICVDANVAAKWILEEPLSDRADALYRHAVQAGQPIVAPPLLPIEVTNILRQRMRRANLSLEDAAALLDRFFALAVTITNPENLHRTALTIAATYDLPAAYDAYYLALAQILGCDFWTGDGTLINTLRGRLAFVRWIGDYYPPHFGI